MAKRLIEKGTNNQQFVHKDSEESVQKKLKTSELTKYVIYKKKWGVDSMLELWESEGEELRMMLYNVLPLWLSHSKQYLDLSGNAQRVEYLYREVQREEHRICIAFYTKVTNSNTQWVKDVGCLLHLCHGELRRGITFPSFRKQKKNLLYWRTTLPTLI